MRRFRFHGRCRQLQFKAIMRGVEHSFAERTVLFVVNGEILAVPARQAGDQFRGNAEASAASDVTQIKTHAVADLDLDDGSFGRKGLVIHRELERVRRESFEFGSRGLEFFRHYRAVIIGVERNEAFDVGSSEDKALSSVSPLTRKEAEL